MNPIEQKIHDLLFTALENQGVSIVRVQIRGNTQKTVQIMIEKKEDEPVSMDDCIAVNHTASALLDLEDPLTEPYLLEVTSPGFDRPLVKKEDYFRFQGCPIKLHALTPIEGRQRFAGILNHVTEDAITISLNDSGENVNIPFENIKKANLVPEYDR